MGLGRRVCKGEGAGESESWARWKGYGWQPRSRLPPSPNGCLPFVAAWWLRAQCARDAHGRPRRRAAGRPRNKGGSEEELVGKPPVAPTED
jgi:hypothetical protein